MGLAWSVVRIVEEFILLSVAALPLADLMGNLEEFPRTRRLLRCVARRLRDPDPAISQAAFETVLKLFELERVAPGIRQGMVRRWRKEGWTLAIQEGVESEIRRLRVPEE
ncbi:MAG: hypothetical protein HYY17_05805 [Planctomycetes bacterium]|nr:hypothetical protein [Planctomycetota bacterium]